MIGFVVEVPVKAAIIMTSESGHLEDIGFSTSRGGAHSSRTIMLDELETLLAYVEQPESPRADYLRAIDEDNCLGKRSGKTRKLTYRHLVDLYALDPDILLFKALRYFWQRDAAARPMMALLCAYCRDAVLRTGAPWVMHFPEGASVPRDALEAWISEKEPERFSPATLKSTAQNINSSLTKSGHLSGRARKIRVRPEATAGAVAYALLLGYLQGARGLLLFQTEYAKLLDCPVEKMMGLAGEASARGWLVFKRVGDVMEVQFPSLLKNKNEGVVR